MNEAQLVESTAAALRQAFDLSFALSPPPASPEVEDLLTLRVAGNPYAIRLRDIAGIVAGRKVVPVPAITPGLLGLAGIRGGVVPVFGLASILLAREDASRLLLFGGGFSRDTLLQLCRTELRAAGGEG